MKTPIPLSKIAIESGILDGVDLSVINEYRLRLRKRETPPPITVWSETDDGYYLIGDGYHRALAAWLEGDAYIHAEVVDEIKGWTRPKGLSWRRPRIMPLPALAPRDLIMREITARHGDQSK